MENRLRIATFVVFSAVLALITALYILNIRFAPDEKSHHTMVRYLASKSPLARSFEGWSYGAERGHSYHLFSPVPYLVHVQVEKFRRHFDFFSVFQLSEIKIIRFGGLIYTVLQFWITYLLVRLVVPQWFSAMIISWSFNLVPQLRYLHSYINADSFSLLSATLCSYLAVLIIKRQAVSISLSLKVGLVVGLVLLSKYNCFPFAAILFSVFSLAVMKSKVVTAMKLRFIGLAIATSLIIGGWFHLDVFKELDNGHVLAGHDNLQLWSSTFYGVPEISFPTPLLEQRLTELYFVWKSTWGWFVRHAELPFRHLAVLACYALVGVLGACQLLRRGESAREGHLQRMIVVLGLGGMLITYIGLAVQSGLGIQGRFLMPAIPLLLLAIVLGWNRLLGALCLDEQRILRFNAAAFSSYLLYLNFYLL